MLKAGCFAGVLLFVFSCGGVEDSAVVAKNNIQELIAAGDLLKAEELLRLELHDDSSNISVHLLLADVLLKKENFSESFSFLQRARALDSNNVEVNLKLSQFYLFLKQSEPSIAHANDVLKVDRNNSKAYFLKGMAFKDVGDTTKALSNFQTAVEQNPDFYEAFIQLGMISNARHDPLALDYFNSALILRPSSSEALYAKAWFYQSEGRNGEALDLYQLIPQSEAQYFNAQYNSGYLHFINKNYDLALPFFSVAAQFKVAKAQYMKGQVFSALGKKDSASFYYRRCLALDSTFVDAKNRLR